MNATTSVRFAAGNMEMTRSGHHVLRPWKGFLGYRDTGKIFLEIWDTFLKIYRDMGYFIQF